MEERQGIYGKLSLIVLGWNCCLILSQSGLYAILGEPGQQDPQASLADMATHARIFYYAQRIGVNVDFAAYQAWLAQDSSRQSPDVLPDEYHQRQQASPPALDWQKAAPKADLYVDRKTAAQSGAQDQPNYPMAFAEMLRLIQEGKPVPGIRQIPNTIIRDPVSHTHVVLRQLDLPWPASYYLRSP